jgi:hypothetical protein
MATAGTTTAVVVTYTLGDDSTTTLPEANYRVDRNSTPGVVRQLRSGTWPANLDDYNAVTVTWWAGYGDPTTVPQRVKSAILMCVHELYEKRGDGHMPDAAKRLLDTVSWGSYT